MLEKNRVLKYLALLFVICLPSLARAATEVVAVPSSTEITEDENVSVEFKTSVDGMAGMIGTPRYDAPDFDEVNAFASTQGMESRFMNGQITVRHTRSVTVVLHPKKAGRLTISNIQVNVNGRPVRGEDLAIEVHPAGAKLGKNQSGTGYPQGSKLPGAGVHAPTAPNAGTFFLKTEPSKLRAYKGEQIILTYSLYTRVQIMNIQVERYPTVNGFLKEDIDIPLLRGHLDYSPSVVNGHEYRRAVLAQYAVYPLKDGTMTIDQFTGKFSFQAGPRAGADDEDPFAMLNQFFRAMQTTTEVRSSDRVNIEVLPLPGAGQPQNFSGLVGDFDITAMVDKNTVKMGDPISVKVKVEGKGHAGSLEHLTVHWPQDFELYEDKSNTQFLRTGHTERIFEYMVIPKAKGKFEIPPIELSMFNPDTQTYRTRTSQPITIEVLEGSLGNMYVAKNKPNGQPANPTEDIRYWKDSIVEGKSAVFQLVARGVAMASMMIAVLSLWSLGTSPDEASRQSRLKTGQAIVIKAKELASSPLPPVEILGEVERLLAQSLEFQYGIFAGSLTRSELREELTTRAKLDETTVKRIEGLVELCESQRYAPGGGDKASAQRAASELHRLVERIYG